jgi:hypothetical protein
MSVKWRETREGSRKKKAGNRGGEPQEEEGKDDGGQELRYQGLGFRV